MPQKTRRRRPNVITARWLWRWLVIGIFGALLYILWRIEQSRIDAMLSGTIESDDPIAVHPSPPLPPPPPINLAPLNPRTSAAAKSRRAQCSSRAVQSIGRPFSMSSKPIQTLLASRQGLRHQKIFHAETPVRIDDHQSMLRLLPWTLERESSSFLGRSAGSVATCAVVGASGSVLAHRHGSLIDAHEHVIRVNRFFATSEYAPHVGTRTTANVVSTSGSEPTPCCSLLTLRQRSADVEPKGNLLILLVSLNTRSWLSVPTSCSNLDSRSFGATSRISTHLIGSSLRQPPPPSHHR